MDYIVHGVAKSRTWLSDFIFTFTFMCLALCRFWKYKDERNSCGAPNGVYSQCQPVELLGTGAAVLKVVSGPLVREEESLKTAVCEAQMYFCVHHNTDYSHFFFAVLRVYTVAVKAKVVNNKLFIASKRSKRLGSCKPLVTTFLSTDWYITLFGVCFCLKDNLLRENGKLWGHLPSTSLPSLGDYHGMISQAFQVLRRKGLLPQSPQNRSSECETPCCSLEQASAVRCPTSHIAVSGPFLSLCCHFWCLYRDQGSWHPKSNLLYIYSSTSQAHLWPDACLTNMSNRRAAVAWIACPGTLLTAEPWGPQSHSLKTSHETISQVSSQCWALLIETRKEGRGLFKTEFLCEKKQTGCEEMNGNEEWTLIRKCCWGLWIPFIVFGKCKKIFELF